MSSTRTYLFGAGASVEASIPTSSTMVQVLHSSLGVDEPETRAVNLAIGGLQFLRTVSNAEPFQGIDIEALYEALLSLAERRTSFLAPFVGSWTSPVLEIAEGDTHRLAEGVASALEQSLTGSDRAQALRALRGSLHEALSNASERGRSRVFYSAARKLHQGVAELAWVGQRERVGYLEPFVCAARRKPVWVATLNYDNALQLAAKVHGIPVDTGVRDRGLVDLSADTPETGIRLAKLHGSVDWGYDEDYVLEELDGPTTRPAIIFGAGNKLQSFGPYLDLLLAFRDRLRVTSHLVVSGYSFRDDHINQLILDWLEPDAARRVTVCDPSLDTPDIGRNLNQANSRGPGFRGTYVMARFDVVKQTTGDWIRSGFSSELETV